jgi:ATP-dependent Lhr-like helicase
VDLPGVSPFAAPVMLELGRVPIVGEAQEAVLEDAAADLIADAMR